MRKIIVEIKPSKTTQKVYEAPLKYLHSITVKNILKLDFLNNIELLIIEILVKDGYDIYKVKWPKSLHFFHVLKKNSKNNYICLIKVEDRNILEGLMKLYDLDVIWDSPHITKKDTIIRSCIADEKNLKKFVKEMEKHGTITQITYKKSNYRETNLLSHLTEKQKDVLRIAKREGYYNIPREINGDGLAKIIGCSKATVLEHLRRVENKIINHIIE